MTIFLLRDDDANATTRPERLARAYAPLLDAGIPICFSVIPEVALDTRAPDGARERFLDEESPDCDAHMPLRADTPLARWLREGRGLLHVLQHGTTHRRIRGGTEFGALSRSEAAARFASLAAALGRAPRGFVAPWDALSRASILEASARFDLVSTGWVDRRLLPPTAWVAHVVERLQRRESLRVGRSWIVRHRGGKLSGATAPADVPQIVEALGRGVDVAVIVLHHWMFWDGDGPHPAITALAKALRGRRVGGVEDAIAALERRPVWRGAYREVRA